MVHSQSPSLKLRLDTRGTNPKLLLDRDPSGRRDDVDLYDSHEPNPATFRLLSNGFCWLPVHEQISQAVLV